MALAARLLMLVALAVTPALCVVGFNEFELRRSRQAELQTQTVRTADQAAVAMQQLVHDIHRFSAMTAKLPEARHAASGSGPADACPDLLASVMKENHPSHLEFRVANKEGVVVCSRGPSTGQPFAGTHVRRAIESNSFVVGGYSESRTTGGRYLTFAHPVRDEAGTPIGAILARVDLHWLANHMYSVVAPRHAVLSVHDRDLVHLLRVPDEQDWTGRPATAALERLAQFVNKGAIEMKDADGVDRLGAIVGLSLGENSGRPDLLIAYGVSRQEAFEEIDAATRRGFALLLLSAALAAGAAVYGGRHFIRHPVERLLAAAAKWRDGDYAARVTLSDRSSEFGRLAAAYETMADELARREAERDAAEHELRSSQERLWLAQEAGGIGLWDWDCRSDTVVWSDSYRRVWRISDEVEPSFLTFLEHVHPDDRVPAKQHLDLVLRGEHPVDIELRSLEAEGGVRWIALKGELICEPSTGQPVRLIGICQDVTERKRAEDHQRLLVGELNHRVKNTLATVQSLAAQSLKNSAAPEQARISFEGRLFALAKTHDVLTRERWQAASLSEIISDTIAPHRHHAPTRFTIDGPPLRLPPSTVVAVSMAVHELCTNAVKYGALSSDAGRVTITWDVRGAEEQHLEIRWAEHGGPAVRKPSRKGFGSRFIEHGLRHQLGGDVDLRFEPGGVVCTIRIPLTAPIAIEAVARAAPCASQAQQMEPVPA